MNRYIIKLALLLLLVPVVAVAQNYGVAHGPQMGAKFYHQPSIARTDLKIGHWGPKGLHGLDFTTLLIEEDGVDQTATFMGALNKPSTIFSINPRRTVLYVQTNGVLTGSVLRIRICRKATLGGDCIDTVKILRDATCYPNTSCTASNNPMASGMGTLAGGIYDSSPFYFSTSSPKVVSKFRGIGNGFGTVNFNNYTWALNVWQAAPGQTLEQTWVNSPNNGNVIDQVLMSESHQSFGTGYLVELTSLNGNAITVLPAGSYLISISAVGSPGWYWNETTTNLGSDVYSSDVLPPFSWFAYTALGYTPGSQALDMFGY